MKIKKLITLMLLTTLLFALGNMLVVSNSSMQETYVSHLVNVEYHVQWGGSASFTFTATSTEELTSHLSESLYHITTYWQGIIEKYDDSFFSSKFLIFIGTSSGHGGRRRQVTSIHDTGDLVEVKIDEYRIEWAFPPTAVDWIIVLEIDRVLLDRTFSIELPWEDPVIISPNEISILLNSERLAFDVAPIIENGRTLVPFRGIFEALEMDVDWDGDTRTAIGTSDNVTIELPIDSTTATVNGEVVMLDVPAMLHNARTMVPLRFIAESTGADVEWCDATRTVTISIN